MNRKMQKAFRKEFNELQEALNKAHEERESRKTEHQKGDLKQINQELQQYLNAKPCPDPYPDQTLEDLFIVFSTIINRIHMYYYDPARTAQPEDSELAKDIRIALNPYDIERN